MKVTLKNFFSLILILVLLFLLFFAFKPQVLRDTVKSLIPSEARYKVKLLIFGKKYLDEIRYYYEVNYNVKKIPEIQFETLDIQSKNVDHIVTEAAKGAFSKKVMRTAYIETLDGFLIFVTAFGDVKIIDDFEKMTFKVIKNNLPSNIYQVVGSHISNNKLYLSLLLKAEDYDTSKCLGVSVVVSDINIGGKTLDFKELFNSNECSIAGLGGEIAIDEKKNYLYFTTGSIDIIKDKAQDDNSIYGKVIQIDLSNKSSKIFAKGFRNPQGLLTTDSGYILASDHGPYGGDELNKVKENNNYGWPISSYGESYGFKSDDKLKFKKNHKSFNYNEPIFAFVPSIGIGRLAKIPNEFSNKIENNYLVSSLNRRSIFRVRFDDNFEKVIFFEEIRVGGRVRDVVYIKEKNMFVLYLEDIAKIMTLQSKNL